MNAPSSLAGMLSEILHGCLVCDSGLIIGRHAFTSTARQRGISIDYSSFWVMLSRPNPTMG
jgi:hypothetical protein